jgi:hypothetical protein
MNPRRADHPAGNRNCQRRRESAETHNRLVGAKPDQSPLRDRCSGLGPSV